MPAGDPAGYLPSVLKSRKKKGQPSYQPKGAMAQKLMHKHGNAANALSAAEAALRAKQKAAKKKAKKR